MPWLCNPELLVTAASFLPACVSPGGRLWVFPNSASPAAGTESVDVNAGPRHFWRNRLYLSCLPVYRMLSLFLDFHVESHSFNTDLCKRLRHLRRRVWQCSSSCPGFMEENFAALRTEVFRSGCPGWDIHHVPNSLVADNLCWMWSGCSS